MKSKGVIKASFGEPVPAGGPPIDLPPTPVRSRRAEFKWATDGSQRVFHGTSERNAAAIANQGVRTNARPLQSQGPGFYTTPDYGQAAEYAERAASMGGGDPSIVEANISPTKGISLKHNELANIGSQFRRKHGERPGVQNKSDTFLGNVALRQKGFDYLHMQEGPQRDERTPGAEVDFGIVLNPKIVKDVSIDE